MYPRLNAPVDPVQGPGEQQFVRDPVFGKVLGITDELGHRILFEIDPTTGRILSERRVNNLVDPDGGEDDDRLTRFSYTASGLVDTVTTADGVETLFGYDIRGRQTSVTYARGTSNEAVQQFEYDAAGRKVAAVDELGRRMEFEYDDMNRVTRLTDPSGNVATFQYDAAGNLVRQVDIRGQETTRIYDPLNRLSVLQLPLEATRFEYDLAGRLARVIDPLGNATSHRYDARGRLVESIAADGAVTLYRYDADDNVVQVTDPEGNRTRYLYDARNRLVGSFDAQGRASRVSFDPLDRPVRRTDRNGRSIDLEYDDLDQVVRQVWFDESGAEVETVDYAYDRVGQLHEVSDSISAVTFTYDARRRVTRKTAGATPGVPQHELEYTYDAAGGRLSLQATIDGRADATTSYAHDNSGRLVRITQSGGGAADKRVDFTYEANGLVSSIERFHDLAGLQSAATSSFVYDDMSRLTELVHRHEESDLASYLLGYDDAGRITSIEDIDGTTVYRYDERNRLTAVAADGADIETYAYDDAGNRIASHSSGDAAIGDGNRLLNDNLKSYSYDAEGNLVEEVELATSSVRSFEYDHRNLLMRVVDKESDGTVIQETSFVYDPFGQRIGVTTQAGGQRTTRGYIYDDSQVMLEFVDSDAEGAAESPQLAVRYLHGPGVDHVLAQENAEGRLIWLLPDHQGTIRDLVDGDGEILNHRTYDSFGNLIAETNAAVTTSYGYTGRTFEASTGLYYYRTRYYDARIGRFTSEDRIGLAGGLNVYAYVLNNPLRFRDPFGLQLSHTDPDAWGDPRSSRDAFYDSRSCPLAFDLLDGDEEICIDPDAFDPDTGEPIYHFGPGNQLLDEGMTPARENLAGRCGAFGNSRRRLPPRGPSGTCQYIETSEGAGYFDVKPVCDTTYRPDNGRTEEVPDGRSSLRRLADQIGAAECALVNCGRRYDVEHSNLGSPRQ